MDKSEEVREIVFRCESILFTGNRVRDVGKWQLVCGKDFDKENHISPFSD